jgi:hypothetical protein
MRYLLLIYEVDRTIQRDPAEQARESARYNSFTEEVRASGVFEAGEALEPVSSATTVRIRDGRTVVTDGPFMETKEMLGGFYLLNCRDLDEAIALAARIPAVERGSIEIRPIWEYGAENMGGDATGRAAG